MKSEIKTKSIQMILLHDVERNKLELSSPLSVPPISSHQDVNLARTVPCEPAKPLEKVEKLSIEFNSINPVLRIPFMAEEIPHYDKLQEPADEP